jgi:hypothetical protein
MVMTFLLPVIGGIGTIGTSKSLAATVGLMCIWGFLVSIKFLSKVPSTGPYQETPDLYGSDEARDRFADYITLQYQATLGAVAYAVGGETPSPTLRQKTYAINIMSATAVSCLVTQVMPYLINTDELNLGSKICFGTSPMPSMAVLVYYTTTFTYDRSRDVRNLWQVCFQLTYPSCSLHGILCPSLLLPLLLSSRDEGSHLSRAPRDVPGKSSGQKVQDISVSRIPGQRYRSRRQVGVV